MSASNYVAPTFKKEAFNCPNCGAFAQQRWFNLYIGSPPSPFEQIRNLNLCLCTCCREYSIWKGNQMIYPYVSNAPLPADDLPDDLKRDYEEARNIVNFSPRGAAALLRLVLEKLCVCLGEKGDNLNAAIANLVKKGLPPKLQKAMDSVRVIGNQALHPGQIDISDDRETAFKLFEIINFIVEAMITQPKKIDNLFEIVPPLQKEAIKNRDRK